MDDWDPVFVDAVAKKHRVILFDNSGVSSSTGEVPKTLEESASDTFEFAKSLGIKKAAILGWSLGGMQAQVLLSKYPDFVTHAIVIGALPPGKPTVPSRPIFQEISTKPSFTFDDVVTLFFTNSDSSRKAAKRSLERIAKRKVDREPEMPQEKWVNQSISIGSYLEDRENRLEKLKATDIPILVINGNQDIACPIENWYALSANVKSAELTVFPDAGHGSQQQYPERVGVLINNFIAAH
jgi:pimeloyl-ACP methyl ester carboxylesterase